MTEVNTKPEPQSVQLTAIENALLKSAITVLMGALAENPGAIALGIMTGQPIVNELGKAGMKAIAEKFEAHRQLTLTDGTLPQAPAIITLDSEEN